jgi:hypothetical protein
MVMFNLIRRSLWCFLISFCIVFILGSVSFAKSKGEIQYELEEQYINNRNDLSWSEKVQARLDAYERIFEPEKRKKKLLKEAAKRRKILAKDASKVANKAERVPDEKESRISILIAAYFFALTAFALIFLIYKVLVKHRQRKLEAYRHKLQIYSYLMLILKLSALSLLIFCSVFGVIEQVQNFIRYQDPHNSRSPEKAATPKNESLLSIAANVISHNTVVLKIRSNIHETIEGVVFLSKQNGRNSKAELIYEKNIQIANGSNFAIIDGQQNGLDRGNYLSGIRIKRNADLNSEKQEFAFSEQMIEKTVPVYLPDVLQSKLPSGASVNSDKTGKLENCYDLGYRFGKCSTKSMNGMVCDPVNDIVLPEKCRNKAETKRGVEAGVKDANAMIVGKKNDTSKTFSGLPELRNRLVGKAGNEVITVMGIPSRIETFAGKECWIYGNTFTSEDIGVVFDGGKVLTVTYY